MSASMLANFRHYRVGATALALLLGVSTLAYASTGGGIDTPTGVTSLPLQVLGTPVLTLHQDLSAVFSGAVGINGALNVNGASVTAPQYLYLSDARLKTDITPIHGALDKVLSIRGVEFNWKQDGRADIGVVAQNVAETFPQLVHKDSKGTLSVEYANMVGPMIEAMRELKAKNDRLESEITQIRAELKQVKQHSAAEGASAQMPVLPSRESAEN